MLKKILVLVILSLSTCHLTKANPQESLTKKRNLNETNCTFDSSQFSNYTRNYQLNSKEFLVKDTIRYCVDYKNNTVFSFKKSNDFSNSKRVDGFLNSGEITDSGLGYYFIYQFEIEEDKLVRYSCRTDGPSSNKCIDNKNIGKWIYGIKR